MSFESLGLAPSLLKAVQDAGFTQPTPVQAQAIPEALAGHDLMVSSQTGSGKTAAFMLPTLHQQIVAPPTKKGGGVKVLVLTPTRELAQQVNDATQLYGKAVPWLKTATVVGGVSYGLQIKALSRRVDVLVATPGRLLDHLNSGRVDLSGVQVLILDEADRMLDMGFIDDIDTIVKELPESRQTLLFSATFEASVMRLAQRMMKDPKRIEITSSKARHENISQSLLYADDPSHKFRLLDHILRDTNLEQAIVFTSTKRGADHLANHLADEGFSSAALHGDMNQRQRTRTLGLLQRGKVQVLVATDVAARGIDVQGISHVVNYDLPMQAEDYVHRIGRTGRAGRDGLAYTLAEHSERHKVRQIERYTDQSIEIQTFPGLEPQRTPAPKRGGERRGNGGRSGSGRPAGRSDSRGSSRFGGRSNDDGSSQRFARRDDDRRGPSSSERSERAPASGDRPWQAKRPASDRPRGDRPSGDRPRGDRPWGDAPREARSDSRPSREGRRGGSESAGGDRPWMNRGARQDEGRGAGRFERRR